MLRTNPIAADKPRRSSRTSSQRLAVIEPLETRALMSASPAVFPVQSHPFGLTYGEWSARQWQYLYSVPAAQSPVFDQTGANFAVGQSGKVWFLAGTFCPSGAPCTVATATRDVTMPSGTALFFPILDAESDNVAPIVPGGPYTFAQLLTQSTDAMNTVSALEADVDGVVVQDLRDYRAVSPPFSFTLPDDNLLGVPAQTVSPAAADGFYLMLKPLSVGQHTVHFAGTAGDFGLDVTYHITVVPQGQYSQPTLSALAAVNAAAQAPVASSLGKHQDGA